MQRAEQMRAAGPKLSRAGSVSQEALLEDGRNWSGMTSDEESEGSHMKRRPLDLGRNGFLEDIESAAVDRQLENAATVNELREDIKKAPETSIGNNDLNDERNSPSATDKPIRGKNGMEYGPEEYNTSYFKQSASLFLKLAIGLTLSILIALYFAFGKSHPSGSGHDSLLVCFRTFVMPVISTAVITALFTHCFVVEIGSVIYSNTRPAGMRARDREEALKDPRPLHSLYLAFAYFSVAISVCVGLFVNAFVLPVPPALTVAGGIPVTSAMPPVPALADTIVIREEPRLASKPDSASYFPPGTNDSDIAAAISYLESIPNLNISITTNHNDDSNDTSANINDTHPKINTGTDNRDEAERGEEKEEPYEHWLSAFLGSLCGGLIGNLLGHLLGYAIARGLRRWYK